MSLRGKTVLVTGASRGIGLAIALRAARDGASIVLLGKTVEPHPKLPGTLHTAAREVEEAGGLALPVPCDIRFEDQVGNAVRTAVERFGGIDVVVNNASAIGLTATADTDMRRFDLMQAVNVRGTFLVSKLALPHLRRAENPHILVLAPPLLPGPRWFAPHLAYSLAKVGMSLCVYGMAEEFRADGIAVNALWPRTVIATAAVQNLLGGDAMVRRSRRPEIVADAAWEILTRSARACTGNFFVDEDVLRDSGVIDFTPYAVDPGVEPALDIFVDPGPEERTVAPE